MFSSIELQCQPLRRVKTSTITSTTGTPSTSVTFLPGNPPAPKERREATPSYLSGIPSSAISSGCQCLNLPTPVTKTTTTSIKTVTTKVPPKPVTKTVYRKPSSSCAYLLTLSRPVKGRE